MPINENYPRYKDVGVAPNTDLAEALATSNTVKAEAIYQQCEKDAKELMKRYPPRVNGRINGWCDGCTPDECFGCGVPSEYKGAA